MRRVTNTSPKVQNENLCWIMGLRSSHHKHTLVAIFLGYPDFLSLSGMNVLRVVGGVLTVSCIQGIGRFVSGKFLFWAGNSFISILAI